MTYIKNMEKKRFKRAQFEVFLLKILSAIFVALIGVLVYKNLQ